MGFPGFSQGRTYDAIVKKQIVQRSETREDVRSRGRREREISDFAFVARSLAVYPLLQERIVCVR